MNILFYIVHPSQLHVFNNLIKSYSKEHNVVVLIKPKDILEELAKKLKIEYQLINYKKKTSNKFRMFLEMLNKNYKAYRILKKEKIDLLITAASDIAQASAFYRIPSFIFNDDDHYIIKNSRLMGWPFSTVIFAPKSCSMGFWKNKTIFYQGYQKLMYLHPNYFSPDRTILHKYIQVKGKYFLIRTVKLTAHHDKGIRGIDEKTLEKLIEILGNKGKVFISSESKLPSHLLKYKLKINPSHIHHIVFYAELLVCDSQSMAHEAAILGTPSIRLNDFAGRIGVLDELEKKYKLTHSFLPSQSIQFFNLLGVLINTPSLKKIYADRQKMMLSKMIDVNEFFMWFVENYPESAKIMKENPDYQYRFK